MSDSSSSRRSLSADHYFLRSQEPLQSLIFMMPLILLYEVGAVLYTTDPHTGHRVSNLARSFMKDFLEMFGAVGDYLPGLAVVLVLLAWHIARRDRWRFDLRLYVAMGVESLALALPLLLFGLLIGPRQTAAAAMLPAAMPDPSTMTWQAWVVLSLGAGVYEELVFRLAAIAILHMIFVDMLSVPEKRGAILAVVCSAILFAAYHFSAGDPFTWSKFVYYFAAGIYFAMLYVMRGFGIVVATHGFYDILVFVIAKGLWPTH